MVKFKDDICAELCLKLCFENDFYFWNITDSGWFWNRLPRNKAPTNHFLKWVWKSNWPEVHCETLEIFPIRGSIKLVIINMKYTCIESCPLSYQCKQLIIILSSCLRELNGCFFLKFHKWMLGKMLNKHR